jgi:phosphoribosylaminoimidazole-succinocarboxamide synthase
MLTETQARELVDTCIENEQVPPSTQDILDSGRIRRIKGYHVKPGKVSDCIHGGKGSYLNKATGETVEYENPPLHTEDGIPLYIPVRTQRISTHDKNRGSIPFKEQILALNHYIMQRKLQDALGNSQFNVGLEPTSVVIAAEQLEQISYEHVVRAFMAKTDTTTSLYQHWLQGKTEFCGRSMPENLVPNGRLPFPWVTPSTKSDIGDESVSPAYLFEQGIVSPEDFEHICNSTLYALGIVSEFIAGPGLITVDTKTEHGRNHRGEIVVQDEIWTMDSSRFWLAEDYEYQLGLLDGGMEDELVAYLAKMQPGLDEKDYVVNGKVIVVPRSFSKEFARGYSQGNQGYTDEQRAEIAVRYIMGIQHLLDMPFQPDMRPWEERAVEGLEEVVKLAD